MSAGPAAAANGALLRGVRKAFASLGDDTTLTRFVRTGPHRRTSRPIVVPSDATRTRYLAQVVPPSPSMLVSGHSNVKIGRDVRKGRLRGYWIYALSLEERATCPRTCALWIGCYGNAMPLAKRVDHRQPGFQDLLAADIAKRLAVRRRAGVLVRLHALGDFFSVPYVRFWAAQLRVHPRLAVFGYTAHDPLSPIGAAIAQLQREFGDRAMLRWSNRRHPTMSTVTIDAAGDCPPNAFVCPEQTDRARCCATCGACWSTSKNVAFLRH